MLYFLTAFVLWNFDAGINWWLGYFMVMSIQAFALIYNSYKTVKEESSVLLKANGQPYTQEDLQFIWKHGYQSAIEAINSTKQ